MAFDDIFVQVGAKIDGLTQGMNDATAKVQSSTLRMGESLGGLGEAIERVKVPFIALMGLMAGGELFKEVITESRDFAVQLEILGQKTGLAVSQLSQLQFAARKTDVDASSLDMGLRHLAMAMQEAAVEPSTVSAKAFKAMGIAIHDAHGNLRSFDSLLPEVANKFASMQDGSGKLALAMAILGRSGGDLIPVFNLGAAGLAEMAKESDRLGFTLSDQQATSLHQYDEAMKDMAAAVDGAKRSIAEELAPWITTLAQRITEILPKVGELSSAIKTLAIAVGTVGAAMAVKALVLAMAPMLSTVLTLLPAVSSLTDVVVLLQMALAPLLNVWLLIGAAAAVVVTVAKELKEAFKADADAADDAAKNTKAYYDYLIALGKAEAHDPRKKQKTTAPALPASGGPSAMDQMELALAQLKAANAGVGDMTNLELTFWKQRLATAQKGSKDYIAIEKNIASLEVRQGQEEYRAHLAMIDAKIVADRQYLGQVVLDRQEELAYIRQHYAEMSSEVQGAIGRLNEAKDALRRKEEEQDKAGREKLIENLKQQAAQVKEETAKIAAEQKKDVAAMKQEWIDAFSAISNAIRTSFRAVIQGTLTMHAAMHNMIRSIELEVIASEERKLEKKAATWLAEKGLSVESALSQIAIDAYQAAAGAYAAISSIPYVGPFLAPAAAATALAGVLALGKGIASAAGGYDVPAGVNPLTQLHAREMVLPASLADAVRGMAGSGGGASHVHHWNVSTMDSKSFGDHIMNNRDALAKPIKALMREGKL